jgi:hypothetical protein
MNVFISAKKVHWDFDRDYIESVDPFERYWSLNNVVFQLMNMRYHSIYLYLLKFLSAMFSSSLYTGISITWLNLFSSISFFVVFYKWNCFLNFLLVYSPLAYRHVIYFCVLCVYFTTF